MKDNLDALEDVANLEIKGAVGNYSYWGPRVISLIQRLREAEAHAAVGAEFDDCLDANRALEERLREAESARFNWEAAALDLDRRLLESEAARNIHSDKRIALEQQVAQLERVREAATITAGLAHYENPHGPSLFNVALVELRAALAAISEAQPKLAEKP